MFDLQGFMTGGLAFLLAFFVAGLFTFAFKLIYQAVTPYNEGALIREGNLAASVALGGALIGYVLPLASALAHTVTLGEFCAWATLAGVIQIVAFTVVRHLVIKDVRARIERGDMATAVYLFAISIVVGVLNAACMTT